GEEPVSGMNGVNIMLLRERDDAGDVEVSADRLAGLADQIRLVGLEAVQREAVFMGVDRDRADAQLMSRAEDANGDFAAIGDQQLADRARGWLHLFRHGRRFLWRVSARTP